jgi:hypothetical protein
MMALDDTTKTDDLQAQADFEAGVAMETPPAKKPTHVAKGDDPEPKKADAQPAEQPAVPKPKYARVTEEQWAESAKRTESLQQQLFKAFGTLGDMQKVVKSLQSDTPRGQKVEIPKDAFAEMEKDFPELARQVRAGVEASLRGTSGTGPSNAQVDPEAMQKAVAEYTTKIEVEALEDAYPDWREIVGAVDITKHAPDATNAYRKWLAGKDAAYQAKINGTQSAAVIARSIQAFQADTKSPQAVSQKAQMRAVRVADAIQPRGDGGPPAASKTENDDFEEGFKSR